MMEPSLVFLKKLNSGVSEKQVTLKDPVLSPSSTMRNSEPFFAVFDEALRYTRVARNS